MLDQEVPGDYTVTPVDKYVNNQNMKTVKTTLSMKELTEKKVANVYLVKDDGTLDKTTKYIEGLEIPAYTSKINLPDMDITNLITSASGNDKVYTFRLVEMSDTTEISTLAEFKLDARTNAMKDTKLVGLKGNRPHTASGSVSFSIVGEDNISKVYYKVLERTGASGETASRKPADITIEENGKVIAPFITVNNNKVDDAVVDGLEKDKAYDVWFRLEDEYGNISTVRSNSILVPWEKAGSTTKAPTITSATLSDFSKAKELSEVELKWVLAEGETVGANTFEVILYKDGKAIAQLSTKSLSVTLDKFTKLAKPLEKGTYHFEIYGNGGPTTLPSATVSSNEQKVSELNSIDVSGIKFDIDKYNKSTLEWTASTSPAEDIEGYVVDLYPYDETNKEYTSDSKVQVNGGLSIDDLKFENISGMDDNKLYKAYVTTKATGDKLSVVNSKEAISKEFFRVSTPVLKTGTTPTSETATFKITAREVSGMTPTYKVKVFLYNTEDPNGLFNGKYQEETALAQDVTVKSDGTFDVTGLQPGTKYVIRLYATVNGIEGVSGYSAEFDTRLAIPTIENKTVVADDAITKVGEIAKTTNGISVDGKEYKIAEYPTELADIQKIVDTLVEGDIFTYTSSAVTIKLNSLGTASRVRALGATIGNRDLYLEGGNFSQTITGNVTGNIIISGNNEPLDITNLTSSKNITVNGGSTITTTTAKTIIVSANSNNNPVKVTEQGLSIEVSTDTKVVIPAKDNANYTVTVTAIPSNDIKIISTSADTKKLTVTFSGNGTYTDKQEGKLDITANGDVTVSSTLALYSDITAKVTDGNITLNGNNLLGAQDITVTNNSDTTRTLTLVAEENAPFAMQDVVLRQYTAQDVTSDTDSIAAKIPALKNADSDIAKINLETLNKFLAKFNLSGKDIDGNSIANYGATITTTANSSRITIKISEATKDTKGNVVSAHIDGLKK